MIDKEARENILKYSNWTAEDEAARKKRWLALRKKYPTMGLDDLDERSLPPVDMKEVNRRTRNVFLGVAGLAGATGLLAYGASRFKK